MFKLVTIVGAIIVSSTQGITINKAPTRAKDFSISQAQSVNRPTFMPGVSIERSSSKTSSSSNVEDSSAYFSCPTYGPFKVGDPNIDVTFTYRLFGSSRVIIERLRVLSPSGSAIYSKSKATREYVEDSLETVTFTLPIKDYLTKDGMTFKFEILESPRRNLLSEYGTTIYPVEDTNLTTQQLKNSVYETKNIAFYGDGETIKGINEKFDFTTIGDYLDIDYYYRLNIKDIFFKYQSLLPFICFAVNLRFQDRENLFPYLAHINNEVTIPLTSTFSNEKVSLKYKNYFYVNRRTLQLSNSSRTGFTLSTNFYLPVNGKSIFNNKLLYLDVVGLGASNLTVSFPIRYVADRSLVGLCGDSGYYVEGGIR